MRGGKQGDNDALLLKDGFVGIDFREYPDMSGMRSRDDVIALAAKLMPEEKEKARANWAAQLWAFAGRMSIGDLVVLPQKATRQLHIGRITGPYFFDLSGPESVRHRRNVEWLQTEIPRTVFEQDLLYSIGAFSTVFQVSRNDAPHRIAFVASGPDRVDPGPRTSGTTRKPALTDDAELDDATAEAGADLDVQISDRISNRIRTRFKGSRLEDLVAAVLEAEGFTLTQRPTPGTDAGVDILAGRGVFGMDPPRIVVQVKSEQTAVGDPVVNALHGAVTREGAEQGLLVALGGVNSRARALLAGHKFKIAVWNEERLLRAIFENYASLPADIKADLPLEQRWMLVEE
ncbi:hypothetical protein B5M43_013775 [Microbacterium sp. MEC084]|uniref:restriction endonuclease n=1 Tax=Microbacterium sp. MEC084 TaxID=1963027 RepID=UPI00106F55A3|nr:restriction endonuclease [Microbacterium sp. MEC084]MCD1269890.1 hypothetical protein [Microbacterium sp. MEC084]